MLKKIWTYYLSSLEMKFLCVLLAKSIQISHYDRLSSLIQRRNEERERKRDKIREEMP